MATFEVCKQILSAALSAPQDKCLLRVFLLMINAPSYESTPHILQTCQLLLVLSFRLRTSQSMRLLCRMAAASAPVARFRTCTVCASPRYARRWPATAPPSATPPRRRSDSSAALKCAVRQVARARALPYPTTASSPSACARQTCGWQQHEQLGKARQRTLLLLCRPGSGDATAMPQIKGLVNGRRHTSWGRAWRHKHTPAGGPG